jgi:hypothetical protein
VLETRTAEVVHLPEPTFDTPEPTPGCAECAVITRQWEGATSRKSPGYDPSKASDLIVEFKRHQGRRHVAP